MSSNASKRFRFSILLTVTVLVSVLAIPSPGFARGELRDPTRPPNSFDIQHVDSTASVASAYELSAILVARGRRIAVINGRPVEAGDRVDDAQVVNILRDKVILRASSGEITLRLLPAFADTGEGAER